MRNTNAPLEQRPKPQPATPASVRSIADLEKLIEDFLRNIEGALHTPYDLATAQKDYEMIAVALAKVEKGMEDRNMLFVTDKDMMSSSNSGGQSPDELLQRALAQKTSVDTDFQKIATAASTAKARNES